MGGAFVSAPLYFYNLGPMSKAEQLQSSKELEESCSASMAGLPASRMSMPITRLTYKYTTPFSIVKLYFDLIGSKVFLAHAFVVNFPLFAT
jgi:hypothetical protein